MKKLFMLTLVMLGITPISGYSLGIVNQTTESDPQKNSDNNHGRPELSAHEGITCEYDGSYLIINFEKEEGMASLVLSMLSDGSEVASIRFSTGSEFIYYVGEISEPMRVEIIGTESYYTDTMY